MWEVCVGGFLGVGGRKRERQPARGKALAGVERFTWFYFLFSSGPLLEVYRERRDACLLKIQSPRGRGEGESQLASIPVQRRREDRSDSASYVRLKVHAIYSDDWILPAVQAGPDLTMSRGFLRGERRLSSRRRVDLLDDNSLPALYSRRSFIHASTQQECKKQ